LDDVLVTLAVVKRLDLLEHAGPEQKLKVFSLKTHYIEKA
jgi:hypothetical protein